MFAFRTSCEATGPDGVDRRVQVAFTDAETNLQGSGPDFAGQVARVEEATGTRFALMNQVHGDQVTVLSRPARPGDTAPTSDALVTSVADVGLMVRVADCVPVVLADPERGVVGAVHSGRPGTLLDIVTRTVESMRSEGAERIVAWIGPHVCGRCYEVPEQMRTDVAARVPGTHATTSWGTPALDLTAGVVGQLERAGVEVLHIGDCTLENESLHSYRRSGADAGRLAGLVWIEEEVNP